MNEARCEIRRREDLDLPPTETRRYSLRFWECVACERTFTEQHPTSLASVCEPFEPKLQVGRVVRVRTNRRFGHLVVTGAVMSAEPGVCVVIDEGRVSTSLPWNAIQAVEAA